MRNSTWRDMKVRIKERALTHRDWRNNHTS